MVADDDDVTEAEDTEGEPDRLDRLESKVDALAAAVGRLVPGIHKASTARVEARLDRPTTVEEQVQAELGRRDKEAKEKEWREGVDSRLAAAEAPKPPPEQPPAPPIPLKQRILGWSR